ncbi:MAG: hypothetical protein M3Y21_05030 [Candidatus Eremiobacteraeota bacterium]|nr:hypothetical protein [Candidatus Eremiobacteraeota bacterium]
MRADDIEDFFAWASTYIENLSPLTGFTQVWSDEEVLADRKPPDIQGRKLCAIIGAVLIDGLLQSKARLKVPDAILPATLRTLSMVFMQCILVGSPSNEISGAASSWTVIRDSLNSPEMSFPVQNVVSFWGQVIEAICSGGAQRSDLTVAIERYINSSSRVNPWQGAHAELLSLKLDDMFQLSREERMRSVDTLLGRIAQSRIGDAEKSAMGGYVLSLVGDGDFALWSTAVSTNTYGGMSSLPMWFGFFTAGSEKTNILSFGQSLGRRLLNLAEYRQEDIDIDARELQISRRLRTRATSSIDFPVATFNVLKAKLAPQVCGWFSIRDASPAVQQPSKGVPSPEPQQATAQFNAKRLQDAKAAAERLLLMLTSISMAPPQGESVRGSSGDEQLELGVRQKPAPRRDKKRR